MTGRVLRPAWPETETATGSFIECGKLAALDLFGKFPGRESCPVHSIYLVGRALDLASRVGIAGGKAAF